MPALNPSTPGREAARAAAAALAAGLGGAVWVLAEAASLGPMMGLSSPVAAVAPRAWALDPATWGSLAGLATAVASAGLVTPLRLLGVALVGAAALGVLHPGAFQRPVPYHLPLLRRAIAYASAVLIGLALPAIAQRLFTALNPDPALRATLDGGSALRLAAGVAVFCAFVWTLAGPGVLNIRALLRFSHGALAGLSIWGVVALAALFSSPVIDLLDLSVIGNIFVAADAAAGAPGRTWGWTLGASMTLYGFALALAGAVAVAGAPQSLGPRPRAGAGAVAAALFALLLAAGWRIDAGARARIAAAAPDLVTELGLDTIAPPRPIVLLLGEERAAWRVPPRQALRPVTLEQDCAPATASGERPPIPAATAANAAKLAHALDSAGAVASGRTARMLGCLVAIEARLFDPAGARARVFEDPAPARVGFFTFWAAVRGLLEHRVSAATRRFLVQLADTSRFAAHGPSAERIARLATQTVDSSTTVEGRLVVADPGLWRIGLVEAPAPGSGVHPWTYAPRNDGQVLQFMVDAVTPGVDGRFRFRGIAPGWYQLALLAPEGTTPERMRTLSVRGDPGQFVLAAATRRDLGTIQLHF